MAQYDKIPPDAIWRVRATAPMDSRHKFGTMESSAILRLGTKYALMPPRRLAPGVFIYIEAAHPESRGRLQTKALRCL